MKKFFLKTLLTTLVSITLPLGLSTVYADSGDPINQPDTSNTSPINATVNESYTITIPTSYSLGTLTKSSTAEYAYADGTVTASNIFVGSDQSVTVSAGDTNTDTFNLTSDVGGSLGFDIYSAYSGTTVGTPITHGDTILTVNNTTSGSDLSSSCHVGINKADITAAGTYTGSLTFTVSVITTP